MTLKEIAKEAGVSISTVSRVVNKNSPGAASKEVQDKIWEIVRRTGYTPNSTARSLKLGEETQSVHSKSIACLFARTSNAATDLFFSSLARSIEQEAFRHNYVVKYTFSSFDFSHPNTFRLITDNQVDGAVILGRCDKPMLKMMKQYFHYVAYTGLNPLDANFDQIVCDGCQAAEAAVNHLIELGHKKIAYIGEIKAENRYIGYCSALASHKLPLNRDYRVNVALSAEGGYLGVKKLLENHCDATAFFCCNDTTAIGAMRALQEAGRSIPKDASIISIDDIETAQYLTPMLSTVHIPVEELGQMTAKILIDRIEGGHHLPLKMNLPFYLASRDSCAPPKLI